MTNEEVNRLAELVKELIAKDNINWSYWLKNAMQNMKLERVARGAISVELFKEAVKADEKAFRDYAKEIKNIMGVGSLSTEEEIGLLTGLDRKYRKVYEFLKRRYEAAI